MPTLDGVLQEGDCLPSPDDFAFEFGDLRPHDRLRRRLLRRHGGGDLGQREPHAPKLQYRACLFHRAVVVDAVAVAIATHGERPDVFPVPQHVGFDPECCGYFSDRLHDTRLAFMST